MHQFLLVRKHGVRAGKLDSEADFAANIPMVNPRRDRSLVLNSWLLGMSLLVRACMNIYVIARHVSDPTYENE